MASIVAALKADDHIGAMAQPIDDLAFSFVAPLGAHDRYRGHRCIVSGGADSLSGLCGPAQRRVDEKRWIAWLAASQSCPDLVPVFLWSALGRALTLSLVSRYPRLRIEGPEQGQEKTACGSAFWARPAGADAELFLGPWSAVTR
jgi:hypothetical protein